MGANIYTFKHGRVKTGGRQRGTPNKFKIAPVREYFSAIGLNPIEKIVSLIGEVSDPAKQAYLWLQILPWCEPKPNRIEFNYAETQDEPDDLKDKSTDELFDILTKDNPNYCQNCRGLLMPNEKNCP